MEQKQFEDQIRIRAKEIEQRIYRFLPEEEGYQRTVLCAMNYTMQAGGKRIRPMLMEMTYQMFGMHSDAIDAFMAAIEMIHTYSLIHDDLPALDNDDYRRGRPTAHKQYGEDMAILAGDGLLNYAFEVASGAFEGHLGDERIAKALMILAKKPGIYGMIGGQTADVELTGKTLDEDQLAFIYENKTGALIEAAMMIGAVLGGANDAETEQVCEAASKIGLAFQIQDDILDVEGEAMKLGKPVGSDEKNDKTTYVTIHGIEQAKQKVLDYSAQAQSIMQSMGRPCDELLSLIQWMIYREV